jgi:hypothetical protein
MHSQIKWKEQLKSNNKIMNGTSHETMFMIWGNAWVWYQNVSTNSGMNFNLRLKGELYAMI